MRRHSSTLGLRMACWGGRRTDSPIRAHCWDRRTIYRQSKRADCKTYRRVRTSFRWAVAVPVLGWSHPFAGGHTAALLTKILFEEPTSLQQFVAIPDHLDALVCADAAQRSTAAATECCGLAGRTIAAAAVQVVRATEDSAAPECLTTDEQRLVSVVLAVTSAPMSDTTERKHDVAIAEVRESLAGFNIFDALADGTLLATVVQKESSSSAPEQAETAALRIARKAKPSGQRGVSRNWTHRNRAAAPNRETASRAWRIGNAAIRKQRCWMASCVMKTPPC